MTGKGHTEVNYNMLYKYNCRVRWGSSLCALMGLNASLSSRKIHGKCFCTGQELSIPIKIHNVTWKNPKWLHQLGSWLLRCLFRQMESRALPDWHWAFGSETCHTHEKAAGFIKSLKTKYVQLKLVLEITDKWAAAWPFGFHHRTGWTGHRVDIAG